MDMVKEFSSAKFWNNVQFLVESKGVAYATLSETIGRRKNYILTATKNNGVPSTDVALNIAQYFDTTVEELAYGNVGLEARKKALLAELEEINRKLGE